MAYAIGFIYDGLRASKHDSKEQVEQEGGKRNRTGKERKGNERKKKERNKKGKERKGMNAKKLYLASGPVLVH